MKKTIDFIKKIIAKFSNKKKEVDNKMIVDYEKIVKTIESCKTVDQARNCIKLAGSFGKKYINDSFYHHSLLKLVVIKITEVIPELGIKSTKRSKNVTSENIADIKNKNIENQEAKA